MNITDALIKLRDDLKDWVAYNLIEAKLRMPTKVSELENDADYIPTSELTLGLHSDGMIYIFKNGEPIGVGIKIEGMTPSEVENLMQSGDLYLNQRYSSSGGGLTESSATGMFCLIIPLHEATPIHILKFFNLRLGVNSSLNNTLFLLDENRNNPTNVNGHNNFSKMTEGVTESDGGKTATVTFTVPDSTTYKYAAISLTVDTVTISEDSVAEYIIYLE